MTICIALVGVIAVLANIGSRMMLFGGGRNRGGNNKQNPILMIIALLFIILAPLSAQFVQLAVSRNREYLADATAVELTRNPVGLPNAFRKINSDPIDVQRVTSATASMYIDMPLKKKSCSPLVPTHPLIKRRIDRL